MKPGPALQLQTLFRFNAAGRLIETNEPEPGPGPAFVVIRSPCTVAWAVREDIPPSAAAELMELAATEPPLGEPEAEPIHASRYRSLVGRTIYHFGPGFHFEATRLPHEDHGVRAIVDERLLQVHFPGWWVGEIAAGRDPVRAISVDRVPVSIAFSARTGRHAAEAGVDTAEAYRGKGLAPRVVAVWAQAVREQGRLPLYSTSWENSSSQRVAEKLGLTLYAVEWALSG